MIQVAMCLASILILSTVALPGSHQFENHFRAPQIRRAVERHSFIDATKSDIWECISAACRQPDSVFEVEIESGAKPVRAQAPVPQVPLTHLLARLKLGPSRSTTPDPFL